MKRKKEYRTTTGLRTYHFGWSSVTKSSKPRGGPGTKVYANAAATHIVYIEDGAVARDGHITYIDSSRVETLPNGERYAVSNISTFYQERVEFFELVEKFERENHGDKTTIDFSMNTQMWAAVAADQECDLTVVQAYQAYLGLAIERATNAAIVIDSDSVIIKPDAAEAHRPAPTQPAPDGGGMSGPGDTASPPGEALAGEPPESAPVENFPTRFTGTVMISADRPARDIQQIVEAIVEQLTTLPGSAVKLRLEIEADVPSGLDRAKVRTLVENANTLGFIEKSIE